MAANRKPTSFHIEKGRMVATALERERRRPGIAHKVSDHRPRVSPPGVLAFGAMLRYLLASSLITGFFW
jgi:hypothetical protein